ncbi:MAG: hypothetical protein LBP95_12270 [Deltaproteobacteria bacterium]|jgi:hypothetical protein|nr:hypothetical protein [Deltaproteobacteria bacterium]MDR1298049.1 hypothetical protein [Deltaproteobacteria bacterium]
MALQKPLISTCIDGKQHSWMVVAEDAVQNGDIVKLEHRWCKKCGCLTQVGISTDGQPVVAVNEAGTPHLAVPKILDVTIK